jgi:dTDP-4-dehydrorhamnose 3,5-epimerase-like enzyme/dTDP-4-dehydrorhamnose reductase
MTNNLIFKDNRGSLLFPIKNDKLLNTVSECTVSINKKNVFRGLHINNFDKLVTCIQGRILDVIIDFNENSINYLIPKFYILEPDTELFQVFVPKNHAHGFYVLEENSILIYHFNGSFINDQTRHIHYLDPYINIPKNTPFKIENPILSEKDNIHNFIKPVDYIIIGGNGYIGSHIYSTLLIQGKNVIKIDNRLQDTDGILSALITYKPKYLINSAGITGKPNIDWCETNKVETIECNITYQLTLAKICNDLNIHLTVIGSGGIFKNGLKEYTEEDQGDLFDNFYSTSRIYLENLLKEYPNVLYLRVNYPVSSKENTKNLLTKIKTFDKISDLNLTITCLDTLIPHLSHIIETKQVGILNFVNKGSINLIDIKRIFNQPFEIIKSNRSSIILDTTKLERLIGSPLSDINTIIKLLIQFN